MFDPWQCVAAGADLTPSFLFSLSTFPYDPGREHVAGAERSARIADGEPDSSL